MSKARRFFSSSTSIPPKSSFSWKTSLISCKRLLSPEKDKDRCAPFSKHHRIRCMHEDRQRCLIATNRQFSGSVSLLRRFSSESGKKSQQDPTPPGDAERSMTMDTLWKESTARLFDANETPIGSMTSLQWHMAETLALYWSSSNGSPPKNHRRQQGRSKTMTTSTEEKWFEATIEANCLSLRIIDRLVDEKKTAEPTSEDDFRTIDVSLIHAVLKQWKDGLHWANNQSKISSRNATSHLQKHPQSNNVDGKTKTSLVLLPSEILQKLDLWTSPISTAATESDTSHQTPLFEPNIATYTILMDGAVSCRNYHERVTFVEDLLDRLLRESDLLERRGGDASRLRPTTVTIGTVVHALANTRTTASAKAAEDWLRKIPNLSGGEPQLRANTVIYTTVIRAWADVGRADKAEGLLREMCEEYVGSKDRKGNPDAKPSLWTFNTVLAAWSRSKNPSSVVQAEGLIRTMKSLSSRKSGENKNDVDEGCAESDKTRDEDVFQSDNVLELDVAPTIVSYNSLLSTIASRSKQPDSLTRAEFWMEEILANAATCTTITQKKSTTIARNRLGKGHKMGRKNDDSMAPNLITYRALFNIIAGADDLTNTEKADRMRYWLARGVSPTVSPSNSGREATALAENQQLLAQIEAMEQRGNDGI